MLDTLASSLYLHMDSPKVLFPFTHHTSKSFNALTLHDGKPIQIVIESHYACRRPKVTSEGHIRIGTNSTIQTLLSSFTALLPAAQDKSYKENEMQTKIHCLSEKIRYMFGLQSIYRVKISTVNSEQMHNCLFRLLEESKQEEDQQFFQKTLTGQILGVTSSGQFCHIGDDGSIVIPWDWR